MTGQFEPAVASLRTLYDCRMIVLIILVAIILIVIMHGNPMIMFVDDSHLHLFNTAKCYHAGQK